MQNVYKRLKEVGYTSEQIYQLLFLYSFDNNAYAKLVREIRPMISIELLEQVIKCITHGTPYELFLDKGIAVEKVIELRRFLEDAIEKDCGETDKYVILAERMIENGWSSTLIYEFRRFLKSKLSFEYIQIKNLFDVVNNNQHCVVVACLYDIACKTGNIANAFTFLESSDIKECLEFWKNGKEEALVNLMIIKEG